jgi:hypothetical protein
MLIAEYLIATSSVGMVDLGIKGVIWVADGNVCGCPSMWNQQKIKREMMGSTSIIDAFIDLLSIF